MDFICQNIFIVMMAYAIYLYSVLRLIPFAKERRNKYFLVSVFFAAFLLIALRGTFVGEDTYVYAQEFRYAAESKAGLLAFIEQAIKRGVVTEIGYLTFEWIISRFTSNVQIFFGICGFIYLYGIYKILINNCSHVFLSTVTFFAMMYYQAFNVMRQFAAVGICCLAWETKKKNQVLKSVLLIVLATLLHRAAIVFFVIFLVEKLPRSRKTFLPIISIMAFFVLFGRQIILLVISYIPIFRHYVFRYGRGMWDVSINGIAIFWIILFIILTLLIYKADWQSADQRFFYSTIYSCIYLTCCMVSIYFDGFNRLAGFFAPFVMIVIDSGTNLWRGKSKALYTTAILALMLVWFMRGMRFNEYYTYSFFWQ